MCDVGTAITVGSFLIQAGSAASSHAAQNKAHNEGKKSAEESGRLQIRDLGVRQQEETFASARQVLESTRDQSEIEGMIKAAAGEAGVEGSSLRLLIDDSRNELSRARETTQKNLRITTRQLDRQADGVRAGVQNQINQNPQASAFSTALRIGGAALDSGSRLHARNNPRI